MNLRLVCRSLGMVALLIGAMMLFSLPWAWPNWGRRQPDYEGTFETRGFLALLGSIVVCGLAAAAFMWFARNGRGRMYRKEAMAVVGLSWVLATVLGALPFYFGGVYRCAGVRLEMPADASSQADPHVLLYRFRGWHPRTQWDEADALSVAELQVVGRLMEAGASGLSPESLRQATRREDAEEVFRELAEKPQWESALLLPGEDPDAPPDRAEHYRIRWVRMTVTDCLFESQSGFSTTGATVIADLEDAALIPHCLLFWRSSTHFLGGLGIIVLFVVVLGQGSAGKALMRAEMPGPTKEGATPRMQHTAWLFAAMYCGLNLVLALILMLQNLTLFDSICHAFGTMATGGFSTYNASLGHFNRPGIEYTVVVFMILAGSNFTLLYLALARRSTGLFRDIEWRTYMTIIVLATVAVVIGGLIQDNFQTLREAIRFGLFQVVSIVTTTGYGTHDFDNWGDPARGLLLLLMFIGGSSGSTGGGMKVIRHVLFAKILRLELELAWRPSVVRPLRIGGKPVDDPRLRTSILVYFSLILVIFALGWIVLVSVEPDTTWGSQVDGRLLDSASAVAATLNNIGPGLGILGPTRNYTHFSSISKLGFVFLMMIGRLEVYAVLVLFTPRFWRH